MPKEQDDDTRLAKIIGCSPEEIAVERERWHRSHIMRSIVEQELAKHIEGLRTSLETISADKLPDLQGQIKGVRTAKAIVLQQPK